MGAGTIVGLVFGVITIVGVVYTVRAWRRESNKVKRLVYDSGGGLPVVRSRSLGDYRLQVNFQSEEGSREIESAHVTYVRFANLGGEAIRRGDIAPANPLRLAIEDSQVLSVDVDKATRDVCRISVGAPVQDGDVTTCLIEFDYLDEGDGALLRLLTEGDPGSVRLVGDIIGMPKGLERPDPEASNKPKWVTGVQVFLNTILILGPQLAIAWFFLGEVERWTAMLWLYAPLVATVVSAFVAIMLDDAITPGLRTKYKFPPALGRAFGRSMMIHHVNGEDVVIPTEWHEYRARKDERGRTSEG